MTNSSPDKNLSTFSTPRVMFSPRELFNLLLVASIFCAAQIPPPRRRAPPIRRQALPIQIRTARQQASMRPSPPIENAVLSAPAHAEPVTILFRGVRMPMRPQPAPAFVRSPVNAVRQVRPSLVPPPQRRPPNAQFDASGDSPPGIRPPAGVALQLNRAKLKDFMHLGATLMNRFRRQRRLAHSSSSAQRSGRSRPQHQSSLRRASFGRFFRRTFTNRVRRSGK